jgi:hypothetical protein
LPSAPWSVQDCFFNASAGQAIRLAACRLLLRVRPHPTLNVSPPSRWKLGQSHLRLQPHHRVTGLNPPISSSVARSAQCGHATGDALPHSIWRLGGSVDPGQCTADRLSERVLFRMVCCPHGAILLPRLDRSPGAVRAQGDRQFASCIGPPMSAPGRSPQAVRQVSFGCRSPRQRGPNWWPPSSVRELSTARVRRSTVALDLASSPVV